MRRRVIGWVLDGNVGGRVWGGGDEVQGFVGDERGAVDVGLDSLVGGGDGCWGQRLRDMSGGSHCISGESYGQLYLAELHSTR